MNIKLEIPEYKELSEAERKAYCANIFAVFPVIEKDIKRFMYEELAETYTKSIALAGSKDERDFVISRSNGIMEGMARLLEHWTLASVEHQAKSGE